MSCVAPDPGVWGSAGTLAGVRTQCHTRLWSPHHWAALRVEKIRVYSFWWLSYEEVLMRLFNLINIAKCYTKQRETNQEDWWHNIYMYICTRGPAYIFIYVSRVYMFVHVKYIPLEITVCSILKRRLWFDIKKMKKRLTFFIPSNSHKASQAYITKAPKVAINSSCWFKSH